MSEESSLNATAGLSMLLLRDVDITYGGTLLSLSGWIGIGLFLIWLVGSKRLPVRWEAQSFEGVKEHKS